MDRRRQNFGPGKCEVNDEAEEGDDNPFNALLNDHEHPAPGHGAGHPPRGRQRPVRHAHHLAALARAAGLLQIHGPRDGRRQHHPGLLDKDYLKEVLKGYIALQQRGRV